MSTKEGKTGTCSDCGGPCARRAKRCLECDHIWRRGRPSYVRTAEHKAKMSAAMKGRPHNYRSASTHPEVAAKIRAWWTPERREEARQRGLILAETREWRDMIARSVMGAKNPNYQGKDNATGYGPGWGPLHRRLVRERAGGRCEVCGREARLDIHHKDFGKDNHDPENLVVCCRSCHKKFHYSSSRPD